MLEEEFFAGAVTTQLPEGTVTILFTDLVDSTQLNQTLGDVEARELQRELESTTHELVQAHKGIVVKGLGDGLMVAFQSARRAVACAQEIQIGMKRRNRSRPEHTAYMRIGLHTGEVIEDSGDLHGETVIIAKRIEGLAPSGGIFVSETVFGVLGTSRDQLIDCGEFELKGIAAKWRLFEVPVIDEEESVVLSAPGLTPYVGRHSERAILSDLISHAINGQGGMVMVAAEAGAGKSRFVRETTLSMSSQNVLALRGHCLEGEAAAPYQPFVEQIEELVRLWSPEQLRSVLGDDAPEVAKVIPQLRRTFSDIGEAANLAPDQERRFLLNGFTDFVTRITRIQPLVLSFEDLDWADESTLLLLTSLAQVAKGLPLLLVGTYRPGDVDTEHALAKVLADLTRRRLTSEIRLAALTEIDATLMLAGLAGSTPPAELVQLIYSETEGNPFFIEELYSHLNERGDLFQDDGTWRSGVAISDTEVPRNVRLLIEQRLALVSESARTALTVAAVIGRKSDFEVLQIVSGLSEDVVLDGLEEAERHHLVAGTNEAGVIVFRFVHEQFRQTLLANLSALRRQRMHGRVVEAMSSHYAELADDHASDIAFHLANANTSSDPERDIHYLSVAAHAALRSVAPEEAIRHVGIALNLAKSGQTRADLLTLRARALRGVPRIDEALDDLTEALNHAESIAARNRILRERAGLHLDLFNGPAASNDLDIVVADAQTSGDRVAELDALLALGRAYYVRSLDEREYTQHTRSTYEATYALAQELNNVGVMIESLTPTVWFTDYWVDYGPTARANAEEALRLATELGDERLLIEAQTAHLRFVAGDEAIDQANEIRSRLEALRDPVRLKEHYYWMMWAFYRRARFEECIEACDKGIALAKQLGSAPVQYGSIKGMALVELGAYDRVVSALEEEVTDAEHPFGMAHQLFVRTLYLTALGATNPGLAVALEAMRQAEQVMRVWLQSGVWNSAIILASLGGDASRTELDQIEAIGTKAGVAPGPRALGEIALQAGDYAEAREHIEPYVAAQRRFDNRLEIGHSLEIFMRIELAEGRYSEAVAHATEALGVCDKTGQSPLRWRLHAGMAQAHRELGDIARSQEHANSARGDFELLSQRIDDVVLRGWFARQPIVGYWFPELTSE